MHAYPMIVVKYNDKRRLKFKFLGKRYGMDNNETNKNDQNLEFLILVSQLLLEIACIGFCKENRLKLLTTYW